MCVVHCFSFVKNRSSEKVSFGVRVCKYWEWWVVVKANVGDEGGGSKQAVKQAVKQSGVEQG